MAHELPILNQIAIPEPCPASWDEMTGDERSRHCAQCEKKVFHLSNMTADEAARVVAEHQGNLCARIRVRQSDGALLTKPTAQPRRWWSKWVRRAVSAAAAIPLAFFAAGCTKESLPGPIAEWVDDDDEVIVCTGIVAPPEDELMGEVELMGDVVYAGPDEKPQPPEEKPQPPEGSTEAPESSDGAGEKRAGSVEDGSTELP